jgi:hypothetical protein
MEPQPLTYQSLTAGMNNLDMLASLSAQLFKQGGAGPKTGNQEWAEEILLLSRTSRRNIGPKFKRLVAEWKAHRRATSLARDLVSDPAYLAIIGMGPDAIPLILGELAAELDHWFIALKSISCEDPVPKESKGKLNEMRDAWLKWGHEKGYAW